MIKIIPSILTNDPLELREMIAKTEEVARTAGSGLIERVSIDIIDGKFADNKTIDPSILADVETSLKLDFQLMVVEPVNWIKKCMSSGAERIIGHIEQMKDQTEFVGRVQEVGASVGLGMDLETPVSKIDPAILTSLDVVLVMSVPAGFGGQKFNKSVLKKIKELDEIRARDDTSYKIHVDGGITLGNIGKIRIERADEVSVGRRLLEGDLEGNIKKYQKAAYK